MPYISGLAVGDHLGLSVSNLLKSQGTFGSRGFGFKVGFRAYGYGSIGWLSIQSRWSCKTSLTQTPKPLN